MMQFPKLTPLQSRLAATLLASAILVILFLSITRPRFAYAAELDSRIPPDHNHPFILNSEGYVEDEAEEIISTTPNDHERVAGSVLRTRAPDGVDALENNKPQNRNIEAGQTENWVLTAEAIAGSPGFVGPGLPLDVDGTNTENKPTAELKKRQASKRIYVTLNTCIQPAANSSVDSSETIGEAPPQLQLWISQSPTIERPGPGTRESPDQQSIDFDQGYAIFEADTAEDVYFGVSAPNTTSWTGIWNYEITASIDAPFHSINDTWANLFFVDGDNHAALLVTNDTTQTNSSSEIYKQWMSISPPFVLFAHNENNTSVFGLQKSFCGLQNKAEITANLNNTENQNVAKMVNRGLTGKPKEQFYINDLNASSTYKGILALEGNSTASGAGVVGGGGKIFKPITFTTKAADNCALMYNLSFCSEVAYAVPSNPKLFDPAKEGFANLAALYDSNAAKIYKNFNYSLQQIPCNVPSVQQYSLVRTCADCARAYKTWLCAVTIPRCEDLSSRKSFLMPRNMAAGFVNGSSLNSTSQPATGDDDSLYSSAELSTLSSQVASNSSRNPIIDVEIRPGPYKEVLPCEDLCYDLMQSCPANLGFGCPLAGKGLEDSYGKRSADLGEISCSYLGAAYHLSGAEKTLQQGLGWSLMMAFMVAFWLS